MSDQSRLRAKDAIPSRVRGRLGAIANEKLGSRYEGADFETTWWPEGVVHDHDPIPLSGPDRPKPSVRVTIRWRSPSPKALWDEDIPTVEGELEPAWRDEVVVDDNPAPEEQAPEGNTRLHEYDIDGRTDDDSLHVEAEFTVVLDNPRDLDHYEANPLTTGPQYEVVGKWNERGVRCKVVRRWWEPDAAWVKAMTWWTGYVWSGPHDPLIEDEDAHQYAPDDFGTVTDIPRESDDPDWMGWSSYDAHADHATFDIGEGAAREKTVTLARFMRQFMKRNDIEATDLYEQ